MELIFEWKEEKELLKTENYRLNIQFIQNQLDNAIKSNDMDDIFESNNANDSDILDNVNNENKNEKIPLI